MAQPERSDSALTTCPARPMILPAYISCTCSRVTSSSPPVVVCCSPPLADAAGAAAAAAAAAGSVPLVSSSLTMRTAACTWASLPLYVIICICVLVCIWARSWSEAYVRSATLMAQPEASRSAEIVTPRGPITTLHCSRGCSCTSFDMYVLHEPPIARHASSSTASSRKRSADDTPSVAPGGPPGGGGGGPPGGGPPGGGGGGACSGSGAPPLPRLPSGADDGVASHRGSSGRDALHTLGSSSSSPARFILRRWRACAREAQVVRQGCKTGSLRSDRI
eukprot:scaffold16380_cov60-Phaeocystis_antarctica.AAC.1